MFSINEKSSGIVFHGIEAQKIGKDLSGAIVATEGKIPHQPCFQNDRCKL